jgi:hypothetical protein
MMENRKAYSHGLLYSMEPDSLSSLHLVDEEERGAFDWKAYEAELAGGSAMRAVFNILKTTAVNWGVIKLH